MKLRPRPMIPAVTCYPCICCFAAGGKLLNQGLNNPMSIRSAAGLLLEVLFVLFGAEELLEFLGI
jgi:hypothetical protein